MTKSSEPPGKDMPEPPSVEQYIVKDPERFAINLARALEEAGKAAAAWAAPRERGEVRDSVAEPVADMVKTFSKLSEYWLSDPGRALEAQTRLFSGYMEVWANTIRRAEVGRAAEQPECRVGRSQCELLGRRPRRASDRLRRTAGARVLHPDLWRSR